MSGDIRSAFITLALSLPAIVLCLSIHETADIKLFLYKIFSLKRHL